METIFVPQNETVEKQALVCLADITALAITTDKMFQDAGKVRKMIAGMKAEIKETFGEQKELAHKTHKAICTQEKKYLEPVLEAEGLLNQKLIAYDREQKEKAEKERARLQAEADEKAREDAKRLAEEERLKDAQAHKDAGEDETAEAILDHTITETEIEENIKPEYIPPVVVAKSGVTIKDNWQYEITDPSIIPTQYCCPDVKAIAGYAKLMKEKARMDGVRFWNAGSVSARHNGTY